MGNSAILIGRTTVGRRTRLSDVYSAQISTLFRTLLRPFSDLVFPLCTLIFVPSMFSQYSAAVWLASLCSLVLWAVKVVSARIPKIDFGCEIQLGSFFPPFSTEFRHETSTSTRSPRQPRQAILARCGWSASPATLKWRRRRWIWSLPNRNKRTIKLSVYRLHRRCQRPARDAFRSNRIRTRWRQSIQRRRAIGMKRGRMWMPESSSNWREKEKSRAQVGRLQFLNRGESTAALHD